VTSGFSPLILRKLSIRRMAGLQSAMTVDELSPGVNVIYGPNGVGKSRTALAINLALWPGKLDEAHRDSVAAWFALGTDEWSVAVDADEVDYQRRGVDADAPILPLVENRDRYNLALQELLADHGANFALAISRESAGGYDLAAAAMELGIDKKPAARFSRQTDEVLKAERLVKERRQKLDGLWQREQDLADWIRDRETSRQAAARAPRLQAALDLDDARRAKELAEERLASFPPAIAKLTGGELERLQQHRQDIQLKQNAIGRAEKELAAARAVLAAARLPDGVPDETAVAALVDFSRELTESRNRIAALEQEVHAATARRKKAAAAIGSSVDIDKLQQLDLKGMEDLAAFSREAEKCRENLIAGESIERWLAATVPQPEKSTDAVAVDGVDAARLEQGVRLLSQWLRQPAAPAEAKDARPGWIVPAAAGLIVLLSLLLAWRWHWSAALLALAGPALYYLWNRRPPLKGNLTDNAGSEGLRRAGASAGRTRLFGIPQNRRLEEPGVTQQTPFVDTRPVLQQQYTSLRLDAPAQWNVKVVENLTGELLDKLSTARLAKERADRLAQQQPALASARQQWEMIVQRRGEIATRLGVAPSLDESPLHALVDAILRWQQEDAALAGASARAETAREHQAQTFTAAASLLATFGYEISAAPQIDAARENLRGRFEQHRASAASIARLTQQIESHQRELAELSERAAAIFTASGLPADDDATLEQWLSRRAEYAKARTSLEIAASKVRELGESLRHEPELLQRPRAELEAMLSTARESAELEQSLTEKIAALRREIDLAQNATELEEAQAQHREAVATLAVAREEDIETAAGWVLLEHLRSASRDRHQSAVFRRAREIFAQVTRGRYRLEFADGATIPEFRCIDTQSGFGQSLDELSSGTRLQLLLAVRVAFVEQQEQGPRLPLILDETLANSDETRARQILDSLIEICRTGRQIFYFTAQPDEVGKWREVLDSQPGDSAVPYKLIDLAAVRGLAESERTPLRQMVTAPPTLVPPPGNLTREAYGRLLDVPGIDPHSTTAGPVHLFHLIDDLPTLHQLLAMGIRTWGQWKTMAEFGGLGVGGAGEIYAQAEARARLIESLARLWSTGRGKPVDRQAVVDSRAISDKYLDAVCKIADDERGDSRRLIARLEERAIAGFRSNVAEKFKNWLADNGYFDAREPLTPEQMRLSALPVVEKDIHSNRLAIALVDEYLRTWFADGNGHAGSNGDSVALQDAAR
jgi:uncharacterized protein YhaN